MNNRVTLQFQVQPSSGIPIYKQIIDQVNRLVLSGHLKTGDELPSVRQIASHFDVNPMTISKAYSILEATGILDRVRGKGMIIAASQQEDTSMKKRKESIRPILIEAATQAKQLAIPPQTVIELFKDILEENDV